MTGAGLTVALDMSCAAEFPVTGVGYVAINQARSLLARGPSIGYRIFATGDRRGGEVLRRELGETAPHIVIPYARLLKYRLWTSCNWPGIEWFTGPVQIAHNLCHQTPATRRARRLVTIHDLSFLRVPETHTERTVEVQTRLLRHCAREADALIAVSRHCRSELMELLDVPPERVHVVPNGVCLEEFERPVDPGEPAALKRRLGLTREYFIYLGTLEPRKNIVRLIEAYERVRVREAEAPQLVLVGKQGWKSEPIMDAVRRAAGTGAVVHAGYLDRREALQLLRGAHACVYPSLYEGFGLPVLEAMAAGTPVVTSNVSALPEVTGDTGILVDPLDSDSIAWGLLQTLEDASGTRTRARAARERAATMTWAHSADALEKVYRAVVE